MLNLVFKSQTLNYFSMVRRIFTLSVTLLVGLSLSAQEMSISDN